jgi:hypothetical protein
MPRRLSTKEGGRTIWNLGGLLLQVDEYVKFTESS